MSEPKNFVATNLSFFAAPEKLRDINFFVTRNIFALTLPLFCDILCYVATFFLGFFSTFVVKILSFSQQSFS